MERQAEIEIQVQDLTIQHFSLCDCKYSFIRNGFCSELMVDPVFTWPFSVIQCQGEKIDQANS